MHNDEFTYRIDSHDTIISVSDNWSAFAAANEWHGPLLPDEVVGHPLWDFIQDMETQHLYQVLFERVRAGQPPRRIPFRCDSPQERRYLCLLLEALPDDQIEIVSKMLRTEHRDPVGLLDAHAPRTEELVTVCSMCKRIKVTPDEWAEMEDGLKRLRLFEAEQMPQLTHGLCEACHDAFLAQNDL